MNFITKILLTIIIVAYAPLRAMQAPDAPGNRSLIELLNYEDIECIQCKKQWDLVKHFSNKNEFMLHLQGVHQVNIDTYCINCQQAFTTAAAKKGHITRVHTFKHPPLERKLSKKRRSTAISSAKKARRPRTSLPEAAASSDPMEIDVTFRFSGILPRLNLQHGNLFSLVAALNISMPVSQQELPSITADIEMVDAPVPAPESPAPSSDSDIPMAPLVGMNNAQVDTFFYYMKKCTAMHKDLNGKTLYDTLSDDLKNFIHSLSFEQLMFLIKKADQDNKPIVVNALAQQIVQTYAANESYLPIVETALCQNEPFGMAIIRWDYLLNVQKLKDYYKYRQPALQFSISELSDYMRLRYHKCTPLFVSRADFCPVNFRNQYIATLDGIKELPNKGNVTDLCLMGNTLQEIPHHSLDKFKKLYSLVLTKNQFNTIPWLTIPTWIKRLELDNNKIEVLPLFDFTHQLEELDVAHNRITHCDATHFPVSLTYLSLSGNRLESEFINLTRLTKLTQLYVLNNKLTSITPAMLPATLERLFVDRNRITTIDPHMLPASLVHFSAERNAITHIQPGNWPAALKNLNLSNNALTQLPQIPATVKVLDISNNPITRIEPTSLPHGLEDLKLDRTLIAPGVIPNSVTKLTISNNKSDTIDLNLLPPSLTFLVVTGPTLLSDQTKEALGKKYNKEWNQLFFCQY